ncbi:AVAST type 2 anti-phage system protein Avs2 [Providencia hangzhouensis]
MEPVSIVASYVAQKIADHITEGVCSRVKRFIFREEKYEDKLFQLIEETINEYESSYPIISEFIPFYHSQTLFEALNDHILFNELPNRNDLLTKFNEYPRVVAPSQNQLDKFYEIFTLKIQNCKKLRKLHINDKYKEKIFDVYDSIIDLTLLVRSLDNKLTFTLNEEWLNKKCNDAIIDLGSRYTPKLNLKLEVANIFEGMGRTSLFSRIVYSNIDNFLIKGYDLRDCIEISLQFDMIHRELYLIKNLYENINFIEDRELPFTQFHNFAIKCKNIVLDSKSILYDLLGEVEVNEDKKSQLLNIARKLEEFNYECDNIISFFNSPLVRLANNPYLLLDGEAGIGKSHLIADIINSRIKSGYPSIFILGQQLTSNESPWTQIFKRLQLNITSNSFLDKLNIYGKKTGKRVLIFIDAINEGNGNKFWKDNINSFIAEIRRYEWLGLGMSIRTSYKNITLSDDQVIQNNFETYKHIGFKNIELDATNLFYDYYKIERPSSPNLNPEFKNPLFLKILCEGIKKNGLNRVPKGFNGITKILGFFIDGVNKSLSSTSKYNFDSSFPLVSDSLRELITIKVNNGTNYILLKDAHAAVQSVVEKYVTEKTFLYELISEGLLTKGIVLKDDGTKDDVVFISFERFDDHLTVNYLLDKFIDINPVFSLNEYINEYFENELNLYHKKGIVEALSIQLPERYNKELYEILPKYSGNDVLVLAFIDSLVWRDTDFIDYNKLLPFINDSVINDEYYYDAFLEMLISVSAVENHPYNADFIHEWLIDKTLSDRDEFWTMMLKYKYSESSSFRHLINWAWSEVDKSYINNESIELIATTLCWFLTSSNRELRDCSTKALISLLENRISIIINLINKFEGVNDPYVWERIFAVALGCTLRSRTENYLELKKLAEITYSRIFKQEYIYPHILLRDYAREIIEYVIHLGIVIDGFEQQKIKPPYNSSWPENIPNKDQLEIMYDKDRYMEIYSSVMGGGDFSRYTIGTNHNNSSWSGCKLGEMPKNRKKILNDFILNLSEEQNTIFNTLDPMLYGKDFEKINLGGIDLSIGNIIGRKSDNEISKNKSLFKKALTDEQLKLYESDIEPYLDDNNKLLDTDNYFDLRLAERFIFNRVMELGWNPEQHGKFDNIIGTGRGRRESNQERIGKKYQWIAYYEFMARLADNYSRYERYENEGKDKPYIGPWDPYLRDIDPTILLKSTGSKKIDKEEDEWWFSKQIFDWDNTFEEWVSGTSTINNPIGLIEVKDKNATEWLVLESYPEWEESKEIGNAKWGYPRKNVWCQIKSYLVRSSDYDDFKHWFVNQNYMGRWMPESSSRYQLFNREYYWSEAFNYFKSDYYGGADWIEVKDNETNKIIGNVSVTSINYLWEEEFDRSKTETLDFLKPSFLIFDKMRLKHGEEEGSYIDENENIICFAAEAINDTKGHLLIKKEPFLKMLEENDLEVVWTLLGEKGVIGSLSSTNRYKRIEFSGGFYIENDEVKGKQQIF